jgi:hypothetical protein
MSISVIPVSIELDDIEKGINHNKTLGTSLDIHLNKSISMISEKERQERENIYNIQNNSKENKIDDRIYCCLFMSITLFATPMIICDLYFGFSNDKCLIEYSENFKFKLKTYLLVSGFIGIINIFIMILSFYLKQSDFIGLMVSGIGLSTISELFYIVWNILGSILFWSYIYPNHKCNSQLSDYLFASFIIKIILCYFSIITRNNDNDD